MSVPRMPSATLAHVPIQTRVTAWLRRLSRSGTQRRVALAAGVGISQSIALFLLHGQLSLSVGGLAAVAVVLVLLAGFWIGTVEFVRMIRGKLAWPGALITTAVFYAIALTIDPSHALLTAYSLMPVALVAALGIPRGEWRDSPRPELPIPTANHISTG